MGDLSLTLVFPLVVIALGEQPFTSGYILLVTRTSLAYVVQGNRYDIIEEVGCAAYFVNTALLYVLLLMWPLLFGTASAIFAGELCLFVRFSS